MSRFYTRGSDSESDDSDSEPEAPQRPQIAAPTYELSDDEEEGGKRIVRSAKEKRYEEMVGLIKKIRNYRKNNDMSNLLDCFEDLIKAHQKALPVILKEEKGLTPSFYLKTLAQLEVFINQQWENKKNMSKNNSKSLSTLRQKLRKYNKDFDDDLVKYRDNPELLEEDEFEVEDVVQDESDAESEVEAEKKPSKKDSEAKKAARQEEGGDDDSEDSYWDTSGSESSDSSGPDDGSTNLRDKFLKTRFRTSKAEKDEKKPRKKKEQVAPKGGKEDIDDGAGWEVVKGGPQFERPKMFNKDQEINTPVVMKKLAEITAVRGKKGTDRREQIELLVELESIANAHNLGPAVQVKIAFSIVAAIFDYSLKVHEVQKVQHWLKLLEKVNEMLTIAISSKDTLTVRKLPAIQNLTEQISQGIFDGSWRLGPNFENLPKFDF